MDSFAFDKVPIFSNLSWIFPFIGHTGICDSKGVIYDFGGSFYVAKDNMTFGKPTRYDLYVFYCCYHQSLLYYESLVLMKNLYCIYHLLYCQSLVYYESLIYYKSIFY